MPWLRPSGAKEINKYLKKIRRVARELSPSLYEDTVKRFAVGFLAEGQEDRFHQKLLTFAPWSLISALLNCGRMAFCG